MLTRTFSSAVREYHYYRRYWSPIIQKRLVGFHEETTPSTPLPSNHTKKMVQLLLTLKFLLDRGARMSAVLTSTHYQRAPLVQGSMEIVCKVTVWNVSDCKEYTTSGPFNRARWKCIQWTNVTYPCLIFGWWDWGLIFIKWESGDKITQNWKKKTKATKSFDIRDIKFPRQKNSDSKRLRVEDENLYMIFIDYQFFLQK